MSFNFASGKSKGAGTTQVTLPPASAAEEDLRKKNLELADLQLSEFKKSIADREAAEKDPVQIQQRAIEAKATQNLLDRLTGKSPVLNPEEQARLDTIYGTAEKRGDESIRQYADELAGMRGMAVSDSPIGHESLRQRRQFQEGLASQRAAASFDLSAAGNLFNQQLQQFQAQLQQQAFANRLALAQGQPASYGMQGQLFNERLAQGTRRTASKGSYSSMGYGVDLGQLIGAAASAYGACWVAVAIFGPYAPTVYRARAYMTRPGILRTVYFVIGPTLARWTKKSRVLRAALRPLFLAAAKRA